MDDENVTAAAWDVALGHAALSTLDDALDREWLVTNGLGGFASGALAGATTRRYHGLLVAALQPPVARTVLVTKVDEDVTLSDGRAFALGTNEYEDGTIAPTGYHYLDGCAMEGSILFVRYQLDGDLTLEKRVWMEHGRNTSFVQYRLGDGPVAPEPVTLRLTPYCVTRDYHTHQRGDAGWRFLVNAEPGGCRVQARADAPAFRLNAGPVAVFAPTGEWYWHVLHRAERERGLDDTEDVYQPGTLTAPLAPGATLTLVLDAEPALPDGSGTAAHEAAAAAALARERARAADLLRRVATAQGDMLDPLIGRLALAADQFIVARAIPGAAGAPASAGRTVIAGYHWFTDWGRDTMIALAGLTLPTGRAEVARDLLRTFSRFLDRGMLPNRFPDGGAALGDDDYNTVDATLWYFVALDRYLAATGDWSLLAELFPALADVIAWHQRGTRFGIAVDARDGLLAAGAPGVQLTWMDAKVADWVVTPRRGKPVEINGLWHNALALMAEWARHLGQPADSYATAAARAATSFAVRFWDAGRGYLADVVDMEGAAGTVDAALRPNQLIALGLRHSPATEEQTRAALAAVERHLLTPLGLRTLSPDDPNFHPSFTGDQRARDGAYHQGTVWPWLIGPYLDARLRLTPDPDARQRLRERVLAPFRDHLLAAGLGSVSEVTEAVAPFRPAGCIAQAWSVAEVLRGWLG
ncbi:MAG TPA: amylo-alpha-1,6-glucosidase [Ktedonobacterales bacterium]|nr:amylo-alpha-1,6-glucosidase [Ktedonobacterales bacterium]